MYFCFFVFNMVFVVQVVHLLHPTAPLLLHDVPSREHPAGAQTSTHLFQVNLIQPGRCADVRSCRWKAMVWIWPTISWRHRLFFPCFKTFIFHFLSKTSKSKLRKKTIKKSSMLTFEPEDLRRSSSKKISTKVNQKVLPPWPPTLKKKTNRPLRQETLRRRRLHWDFPSCHPTPGVKWWTCRRKSCCEFVLCISLRKNKGMLCIYLEQKHEYVMICPQSKKEWVMSQKMGQVIKYHDLKMEILQTPVKRQKLCCRVSAAAEACPKTPWRQAKVTPKHWQDQLLNKHWWKIMVVLYIGKASKSSDFI